VKIKLVNTPRIGTAPLAAELLMDYDSAQALVLPCATAVWVAGSCGGINSRHVKSIALLTG
jgi:hypothetical protein